MSSILYPLVHAMGKKENLDDSGAKWFPSVNIKSPRKRVTALIKVNESDVTFQLDSASDVNTIRQNFVKKRTRSDPPRKETGPTHLVKNKVRPAS